MLLQTSYLLVLVTQMLITSVGKGMKIWTLSVASIIYMSPRNPGSDVAGEMAAASLVFWSVDPVYSKKLLGNAVKVFRFAVQYKGSYSDSLGSAALVAITTKSGRREPI